MTNTKENKNITNENTIEPKLTAQLDHAPMAGLTKSLTAAPTSHRSGGRTATVRRCRLQGGQA
jgi:hypothetical protein